MSHHFSSRGIPIASGTTEQWKQLIKNLAFFAGEHWRDPDEGEDDDDPDEWEEDLFRGVHERLPDSDEEEMKGEDGYRQQANMVTPTKRPVPVEPGQTGSRRKRVRHEDLTLDFAEQHAMPRADPPPVPQKRGRGAHHATDYGENEAPVVPPPAKVSKIINDYFTVSLPLANITVADIQTGDSIWSGSINLNTINNPITWTPHGTAYALQDKDYRGLTHWATTSFQYYRVLKTDVKLTWFAPTQNCLVGWSLHEDSSHSNWTTSRDMMEMKHGGFDLLQHHGDNTEATTDGPGGTINRVVQQYTYIPGSWDHHVSKYGDEERWTAVTTNPAPLRFMHFGVCNANGEVLTTAGTVRLMVQLLCTVQFREATESILTTEVTS